MRMHLKSREIAFAGLMMALGVVLILLGGYIGTATLFFLAASAFLAGVMERNFSLGMGALYLAGAGLLGFFLSPRKLHVATFAAMGIYVLVAEWFEKRCFSDKKPISPVLAWAVKFLVYQFLLAVALGAMEGLMGIDQILTGGIFDSLSQKSGVLSYLVLILMAEILWLVFDRAYLFFRRTYGNIFHIPQ